MSNTNPVKSNYTLLIAMALVALGAGLLFGLWAQRSAVSVEDIDATIFRPPAVLEEFRLATHTGSPFTLKSLMGKWSFMFFGYTNCPDVCPTTLNTLALMDKYLAKKESSPGSQVIFVSVDPNRDSVERLSEYVPYFNPAYIGVTGSQANINRFTGQLGILHVRVEQGDNENYLVNHTSSILLFNPKGELSALFSSTPFKAVDLAENFLKIVQLSSNG